MRYKDFCLYKNVYETRSGKVIKLSKGLLNNISLAGFISAY